MQFQDGTIDENQWSTEEAVLMGLLDSDMTRLWWQQMGQYVFGEAFVGFVDQLIAETPATNTIWRIAATWSSIEPDDN